MNTFLLVTLSALGANPGTDNGLQPVAVEQAALTQTADTQKGGVGCETGCCSDPCGCGHNVRKNLPCPWHSPRNMTGHVPYEAYPWTYYYFRPYNHLHIASQQQQASEWGADPQMPYSNAIFEKVYQEVGEVINAPLPPSP